MHMDGSLHVVTRDNSLHLHHAFLVSRPHAAKESCVIGMEIEFDAGDKRYVQLFEELFERSVGVALGE